MVHVVKTITFFGYFINRVSELAGAKISTGNPNLVDISDANRPSKLAERYNELYDNDWADAFALLTENGIDEKLCIDKLREVLMVCTFIDKLL